eukprot:TRINITY_DN1886_c0_g2_i14.p1 TRINITY_DN1886_c0_g2~~TRINITY_DN1886_c0_g2_i14.p1  ORF type:complete len:182 (+),score=14.98 TRINITY_DN1886_c0_g2_i14:75-620(+)
MCIVLLALNHKGYKLIILVNRDEYLDRPTSPASWWETDEILASRDLVGGGIQFGVTKQGRFAVLTNYREKHEVTGFSRGTLTLDFLKRKDLSPLEYLTQVKARAHLYSGFNLLVGNYDSVWYYSNREHEGQPREISERKVFFSSFALPPPTLTSAFASTPTSTSTPTPTSTPTSTSTHFIH